jgi:hypothetical protein
VESYRFAGWFDFGVPCPAARYRGALEIVA